MTSENRKRRREEEVEPERVEFQENPIIRSGDVLRWKFENLGNWNGKFKWSDELCVGDKFPLMIGIKKHNNNLHGNIWPSFGGKDRLIELSGFWRLIKENDSDFHHEVAFTTETASLYDWSALTSDGVLENNSIILEVEFDMMFYDFRPARHYSDVIQLNLKNTRLCFSKDILCIHSKFFYNKYIVEKAENELRIEGCECYEMCHFLGTMCSIPVEIKRENYGYLMKLAQKFEVASLHYKCQQFLIDDKEIELIDKLQYAEKYAYKRLMKTCVDSLKNVEDVRNVTKFPSFKSLTENTQHQILKRLLRYL